MELVLEEMEQETTWAPLAILLVISLLPSPPGPSRSVVGGLATGAF